MTVRIGIIGAGVMGADHARTLHESVSGATVTAIADPLIERAQAVAAATGATCFGSAEELIASSFVDAVLIASHDSAHADQVISCLEHRKPVLCEKPLAPSIDECQGLVDRQRALGRTVPLISVGFMRRFHPAYQDLKARVEEGTIGQPLMILSSHRNVRSYPAATSASTITNSAIHEIDITAWLLDSAIESVSWHAPKSTTQDPGKQDPQILHLRTTDGALTVVDVFLNARYGYDVRCEVVGEWGTAELARPQQTVINGQMTASTQYADDWRPVFAEAYRRQSQAWVDSLIAGRRSPLATAEDALQAIRVAEALVASMESGGAIISINQNHTAAAMSAAEHKERTVTNVR
ncbi:Gfo/Idh/MocA family oxidoreductase [Arthrobacter sp. NQ7]|uniref:Gfo/Idh/MocA family protein n=1 Tax=Arthrobacter sp. NQ7 TaxID=3032303 RepID=UPI00240F550A|nr:Gfo/Idh/MocA family oxidoreductase [Arthrobacter sp. NQ7]MDJ0458848.1 Gfo/Idh/MocA family oxidoreductase [Arthrobacter sp. NQ7]